MPYRLELSPNNRATCSAPTCKKEGKKIEKGEIRQGVLVQFKEHDSWKYRHWGCVTPEVIHNWKEESQEDMELVDGYEVLPEDVQEKIKRAFDQGHVDDADWNGDVEMNRYVPGGKRRGMFVKTPKKKAGDEDDENGETPVKKSGAKKRGRAKAEDADVEEDEKPAKKPRGKKAAKVEDEDDEPAPPPKKAKKAKKTADDDDDQDADPAPKKGRGRKAKPAAEAQEELADEASAPAKKARAKKVAKPAVQDDEDDEPVAKKAKPQKGKGRSKKAAAVDED